MKIFQQALLMTACSVSVTITGHAQSSVNPAPFVIPALREWHGATGSFIFKNKTSLVVDPFFVNELLPVAFKGYIDNVKVFNCILPDDNIQKL